jgi:hypothetical protein
MHAVKKYIIFRHVMPHNNIFVVFKFLMFFKGRWTFGSG